MAQAAKKTHEIGTGAAAGRRRSARAAGAAMADGTQGPTGRALMAGPQPARSASKRDLLATLLVRDAGATIAEMQAATGWLPHTVRAALTGLRKRGYAIDSDRVDNVRTYRAVAPE